MAFERTIFQSLMPATITVSTRTTHSLHGTPSYSTSSASYRARIIHKPGFVRTGDRETKEFRTILWVASTGTLDVSDRITLPDGSRPPVVAVERYPDDDGTHHHKVFLGW